jgi:hypothetical protein
VETTVTEAQCDIRRGYYSGARGILASALAWSVAAGTAAFASAQRAIWALGLVLAGAGTVLGRLAAPARVVAAAGAAIELAFAAAGIVQHRHWVCPGNSSKPEPLRGAARLRR